MDPSEDKVFLQALELEAWGVVFLVFCFVLSFFFFMYVCVWRMHVCSCRGSPHVHVGLCVHMQERPKVDTKNLPP